MPSKRAPPSRGCGVCTAVLGTLVVIFIVGIWIPYSTRIASKARQPSAQGGKLVNQQDIKGTVGQEENTEQHSELEVQRAEYRHGIKPEEEKEGREESKGGEEESKGGEEESKGGEKEKVVDSDSDSDSDSSSGGIGEAGRVAGSRPGYLDIPKLWSHHKHDTKPKAIAFAPDSGSTDIALPGDEARKAFTNALDKWVSQAQEGEYPEPLTQAVPGACSAPQRFGGSQRTRSPTGWVVCLSNIPRSHLGNVCKGRPCHTKEPHMKSCVVYSFGVGEEDSFEQHIAHDTNCTVHAFDPVKGVISWVTQRNDAAHKLRESHTPKEAAKTMDSKCGRKCSWYSFLKMGQHYAAMVVANTWNPVQFHPWGLAATSKNSTLANSWSRGKGKEIQLRSISDIMDELGHDHIDILKLDIEGFEWEVLEQVLAGKLHVDQLMLEMHFGGAAQWLAALDAANQAGFEVFYSEKLRYHGRGCKENRVNERCRGALQEVAFLRRWK